MFRNDRNFKVNNTSNVLIDPNMSLDGFEMRTLYVAIYQIVSRQLRVKVKEI